MPVDAGVEKCEQTEQIYRRCAQNGPFELSASKIGLTSRKISSLLFPATLKLNLVLLTWNKMRKKKSKDYERMGNFVLPRIKKDAIDENVLRLSEQFSGSICLAGWNVNLFNFIYILLVRGNTWQWCLLSYLHFRLGIWRWIAKCFFVCRDRLHADATYNPVHPDVKRMNGLCTWAWKCATRKYANKIVRL